MQLNQTTLRGILAAILSVDENHVVPKQGNWWNPQQKGANIDNWCAYRIRRNQPRTAPFYMELEDGVNSAIILKIASIELQFVGPRSEELAQSVALWPLRGDVQAQFAQIKGSVMYSDYTAVSSDFYQDGLNTVVAWNIPDLRVLWYDSMETSQKPIKTIDIGGRTNV
jgi:hypothetical protein